MRRRLDILGVVLLAIGLASETAAQGVRWRTDLEEAKREAAQSGRLVLLHFGATWCKPCQTLEETVFTQPQVGSAIEQHFVPVKIDVDQHPEVARQYEVKPIPADVVITPDGGALGKNVGSLEASKYVEQLTQIALAAKAKGPQGGTANHGAANHGAANHGAANNGAANNGQRSPLGPKFGGPQPAPGQPIPPQGQNPIGPSGGAPWMGHPNHGPPAGPTTVPPSQTPIDNRPPWELPPRQQQPPQQPPQRKLPPMGFDGYCLISMQDHQVWMKGDPRWGAIHEGRLYFFVNLEARNRFLATPLRYAPAFSEHDVVLFAETGQRVSGKRGHGAQYQADGDASPRIYLFANEESLQKFEANPAPYAARIRGLGQPHEPPRR